MERRSFLWMRYILIASSEEWMASCFVVSLELHDIPYGSRLIRSLYCRCRLSSSAHQCARDNVTISNTTCMLSNSIEISCLAFPHGCYYTREAYMRFSPYFYVLVATYSPLRMSYDGSENMP